MCLSSFIHWVSVIHSFLPSLSPTKTYYVLGPRPGPGHTFQDLLLGEEQIEGNNGSTKGREFRGALTGSLLSTPAPPDAYFRADALRQRYPRVPGEHGLADTGQEATQRLWERDMGHLGGEAGPAQRPRHLIQCLGACQAEGRQCQGTGGQDSPGSWGVSWAPGLGLQGCPVAWENWACLENLEPGFLEGGPARLVASWGTHMMC